eukprot:XP_001695863.1 predicted protein [Chlamydomonas reinhardtii]
MVELLRRAVLGWKRRKFCGLDSLVSFSACVIAARRAFETELPDAYIRDPLAEGLCGKEALESCRKRLAASELKRSETAATATATTSSTTSDAAPASAQPGDPHASAPQSATAAAAAPPAPEQQAGQGRAVAVGKRPISRLIIRTKFFDDVASIVTWHGAAAAATVPCHVPLAAVCRAAAVCRQVVLLGSGLDSRPWRLALPPGVAWFEVDRRDVLAAKTRRLKEMGAQTRADSRPQAALQMHSLTGAGSGAVAQQQQQQAGLQEQQGQGQRVCTHPLTARSWDCVAVDLQHRGWSRGLLRAGLDPAQPVCWILEGLLYYLEERDVRALLQEAASVSAPGSVLAASIIQAPPAPPAATAGADSGSGSASSAATPTAAAASAAATPPSPVAAPGTPTVAAAAADAASVEAPSKGAMKAEGKGSGAWNVRSEFKWRCEGGVSKFLAECGWSALWTESWLQTVQSYGLTPEGGSTASGVYFTSAKLA